jgi:hypothetical protein
MTLVVTHFTSGYKETIRRLEHNELVGNINTKIWTNKYGEVVAEGLAREMTNNEIINSKNKSINILTDKVKQQGIKIKNVEYQLSIALGLSIDTLIITKHDTIIKDGKVIVNNVDNLTIGDFKLVRTQQVNTNNSHYEISYTPTLYISISHYKEGKWRLRNLFHKRDVRYKATITTSDSLLKPKEIIVIKAN